MTPTPTTGEATLLPCPFCGNVPEDDYSNGERTICCHDDQCPGWRAFSRMGPDQMERMGLPRDQYQQHAAKRWNTRAPSPAMPVVTVTEEMVERACAAYDPMWNCRLMVEKEAIRDRMRAALVAALSVAGGGTGPVATPPCSCENYQWLTTRCTSETHVCSMCKSAYRWRDQSADPQDSSWGWQKLPPPPSRGE